MEMIPQECKRLAEVDFPIAEVSRHAVRDGSRKTGHPKSLHKWWAWRPLASSRAVLMGLLMPDPCDENCPERFKQAARALLPTVGGGIAGSDQELRGALLKFIGDSASWEAGMNRVWMDVARALVKAANGNDSPLVVDPFAGRGSIPLEALRLDCEAFASDLNPVACLILKVMLEDIPRHGSTLAEELRRIGGEVQREAEPELADLYPKDSCEEEPVAYLWARTVRCEASNCGAEIPLVRSFWLCKKPSRKWALRHKIERPQGIPQVEFDVFEPKADSEVSRGTVARAKATCLCCKSVMSPERVRAQIAAQSGGADSNFNEKGHRTGGARILAVVTRSASKSGKSYRLPTKADYAAVHRSQARLEDALSTWERDGKQELCPVPDEPLPPVGTLGFRVQRYGMLQWGDLFTARQKYALVRLIGLLRRQISTGIIKASQLLCALCIDRVAMHNNTGCRWKASGESLVDNFGRQAVPIVWDFAESVPTHGGPGNFERQMQTVASSATQVLAMPGIVEIADATRHPLPDQSAQIWFTDPPYYDAIPYADLSDFFLVWLKRTLPGNPLLRDPFDPSNPLAPKAPEAVQDESKQVDGRPKDREWFEETMAKAFAEGRRVLSEDGVGSVVFAHKTTEGWEALLSGMIRGGWTITGSWPIATEMASRLRARDSAALATSVHLICRPRPENAPVGDWADVLRQLPIRVTDWIERLQNEGIRGADLVFACIGPALEIFSRYRAVETAEGKAIDLPEYLEKVWEVVGRAALQQVLGTAEAKARGGLAGALEEDARLTALFLWTVQSTEMTEESSQEKKSVEDAEEAVAKTSARGFTLPFDVVRRFAQPMGIDLEAWTNRIIAQSKGVVRLLPVAERAAHLFGKHSARAVVEWIENDLQPALQQTLFPELRAAPSSLLAGRKRRRGAGALLDSNTASSSRDATTLDRVHAAMLLQSSGHASALRSLIEAEEDRGPDFLRLANALSALYPRGSREKRLLDAMLLAVPR